MFWIAVPRGHTWGQTQVIPLHVQEALATALNYEVEWLHYQLWPRAAGDFFDQEGAQVAILCLRYADSGLLSPPFLVGAVWITFSCAGERYGHHVLERSFFSLDGELQYIPLTTAYDPLRLRTLPALVLPGAAAAQDVCQRWAAYSTAYIWSCSLLGPPRGSGCTHRPIEPL